MKIKLLTITIIFLLLTSCEGEKKQDTLETKKEEVKKEIKKENSNSNTNKIDLDAPTLDNKGIGPIKSIKLEAIDEKMVAKGKDLYKKNCTACHKFKKRYIGPALKGMTKIRSPEWIMNMMLNTTEMLEKDPVAKALMAEYSAPMAQQNLSEEEARAILEYLRTKN